MTRREFDELIIHLHHARARLSDAHQAAIRVGNTETATAIYEHMLRVDRTVAHVVLAQSRKNLARAA